MYNERDMNRFFARQIADRSNGIKNLIELGLVTQGALPPAPPPLKRQISITKWDLMATMSPTEAHRHYREYTVNTELPGSFFP